jgi:uncharacterized membrane protein HdeD (DUF308 family)
MATDPAPSPLAPLRRSAGLLAVVGVASVVAGILVIVYPDITLVALAVIAGVNFLIIGAFEIVEAIVEDERDTGARVLVALLGMLAVIVGLVVLRHPAQSLLALVLAIGIWLVLAGIVDLAQALVLPGDRLARAVVGACDLVLGILLLALPDVSLKTLAVLVGIGFVVRGLLWLVAAWGLRGARAAPGA